MSRKYRHRLLNTRAYEVYEVFVDNLEIVYQAYLGLPKVTQAHLQVLILAVSRIYKDLGVYDLVYSIPINLDKDLTDKARIVYRFFHEIRTSFLFEKHDVFRVMELFDAVHEVDMNLFD